MATWKVALLVLCGTLAGLGTGRLIHEAEARVWQERFEILMEQYQKCASRPHNRPALNQRRRMH